MVSAGFAGGRFLALVAVRHTLLHPGLLALAHDCGRLLVLRRPLVHIVVIHPRRAPALAWRWRAQRFSRRATGGASRLLVVSTAKASPSGLGGGGLAWQNAERSG